MQVAPRTNLKESERSSRNATGLGMHRKLSDRRRVYHQVIREELLVRSNFDKPVPAEAPDFRFGTPPILWVEHRATIRAEGIYPSMPIYLLPILGYQRSSQENNYG